MKIRDYTILEATDPQALVPASGHGPVHQTPSLSEHPGCDGWIFVNFCQAMVLPWEGHDAGGGW